MKYTFGPVPSRRLGRSLGVNPIPFKTCNYSCVYCQLGRAINFTNERREFFSPDEIRYEIIRVCTEKYEKIDFVTFVGEGEPTLQKGLARIVEGVKKVCNKPLAIITNGALFYMEEVRRDVMPFDVILTKIDAPCERLFRKINRPHRDITFNRFLAGLFNLKKEYKGQLWIETMLVKGLNDSKDVLLRIRGILDRLEPDRRFVTIPTRPPAENWVKIPTPDVLFEAFRLLDAIPIYDVEYGEIDIGGSLSEGVANIIKRHPLRMDELIKVLKSKGIENPENFVEDLIAKYGITLKDYLGYTYLLPPERR